MFFYLKLNRLIFNFTIFILLSGFIFYCSISSPERDNSLDPKNTLAKGKASGSMINEVVRNGLQHWWNFNGNLLDKPQNGATITNGSSGPNISTVTDRFGNGLGAQQVGDGLLAADTIQFSMATEFDTVPFSYDFWFKPASGASSRIIGKTTKLDCSAGTGSGYLVYYDVASKQISFCFPSGTTTPSATSQVLTTSNWYHIVFTYDGSNAQLFVKDNAQTIPFTGPEVVEPIPFLPASGSYSQIDGNGLQFDDFKFYNRVLSLPEIDQNHVTTEQ